ncbi:hypothetical protein [Nocardia seriolae]|uniref:Uncharacterized protein n=1 Tax=Nocardia seriolae TaxID=37332 RepID=A0A0B8ND16_9NOCA|nr:hypothetical protein [Nocardia seriolae]APA98278.1 hypothetical protein NS506_04230 [Nocardia seriolae]MTJ62953.1 hypothetical protein [Nocardia seriolae]MTJ73834.1 hypothetical protein [Nocardia seriolae]MTJ87983.1 hypothetical protein [Nocardia seriolae]MTK31973.1 hypothetical protein [Nocardia seriolae]
MWNVSGGGRKVAAIIGVPVAAVAVGAVAIAVAAPAQAQANHPGACIVVQNHTGRTTTVSMNYPAGYNGDWTIYPNDLSLLLYNGDPVKSPTGAFNIQRDSDLQAVWNYDPGRARNRGCNGSWVVTLN